MQAPVTQLYENTWAIEDRGVRIFVLERVFPEKLLCVKCAGKIRS